MPTRPRLRDAGRLTTHDLYPLNVFPDDLIRRLGGYLVYLIYIGRKDIMRDDWEMHLLMQSEERIWNLLRDS